MEDCILFCWQTEGIVAHRVKHRFATHAPVTRLNIGGRISLGVPHMQTSPAWIGEHVQDIDFLSCGHFRSAKCFVVFPISLPFRFDNGWVVSWHLKCRWFGGVGSWLCGVDRSVIDRQRRFVQSLSKCWVCMAGSGDIFTACTKLYGNSRFGDEISCSSTNNMDT